MENKNLKEPTKVATIYWGESEEGPSMWTVVNREGQVLATNLPEFSDVRNYCVANNLFMVEDFNDGTAPIPTPSENQYTAHTPRPWEAEELKIISTLLQSVVAVCEIYDRDTTDEEENANVRLIAAAPDLLEALQFYVSICGNTGHSISRETAEEMYEMGTAAINKATRP